MPAGHCHGLMKTEDFLSLRTDSVPPQHATSQHRHGAIQQYNTLKTLSLKLSSLYTGCSPFESRSAIVTQFVFLGLSKYRRKFFLPTPVQNHSASIFNRLHIKIRTDSQNKPQRLDRYMNSQNPFSIRHHVSF
jgi:hypothetical protein